MMSASMNVPLIDQLIRQVAEYLGQSGDIIHGAYALIIRIGSETTPVGSAILLTCALVNMSSLFTAYRLSRGRDGQAIDNLNTLLKSDAFRGPRPRRCASIQRQYNKRYCDIKYLNQNIIKFIVLYFFFGFIIPTMLLLLVVRFENIIFSPGIHILSKAVEPKFTIDSIDQFIYLLNEILHILTDALSDTFNWSWSEFHENGDSISYRIYLALMYRMTSGGFFTATVFLAVRYIYRRWRYRDPNLQLLQNAAENAGYDDGTACVLGPPACELSHSGYWRIITSAFNRAQISL